MEDNQAIICRYCFADETECTSKLVYTCSCKTPICEMCFETHLNNKKNNQCEICRKTYEHHFLTLYNDPMQWLLTRSDWTLFFISIFVIISNISILLIFVL